MAPFDIYHHPTRGYQVVQFGFSWPAFLLSGVWALSERLWSRGVTVLGMQGALLAIQHAWGSGGYSSTATLAQMLTLGVCVSCGALGNGWRTEALQAGGYVYHGMVRAASAGDALKLARNGAGSTHPSRAAA